MATPDQPVLRLCASFESLPREQCAVPDRCVDRECARCGQPVHYDPAASIPLLGPELIVCGECLDELVQGEIRTVDRP